VPYGSAIFDAICFEEICFFGDLITLMLAEPCQMPILLMGKYEDPENYLSLATGVPCCIEKKAKQFSFAAPERFCQGT